MKTKSILFIACVALLGVRCMMGGSSSSENTYVVGALVDQAGTPSAAVVVKMIPSTYNPVLDAPLAPEMIDTTDSAGAYQFELSTGGVYTIQALSLTNGTRMLRKNVDASGDTVFISRDTLCAPGTIKAYLPDAANTSGGYAFIQGTDRFAKIDARIVYLDSVAKGETPPVYATSGSSDHLLADAVTVLAGDTAVLARVLLIVNPDAGGVAANAFDQYLQQKIGEMGITISVKGQNAVSAADTAGIDCIVLSASIDSPGIGDLLSAMEKPIVNCNVLLLNGLAMTGGVAGTDFGVDSIQWSADLTIGDSTHPVAGGRSGLVQLFQNTAHADCWGKPVAGTPIITHLPQYNERSMVFCYDRQAAMIGATAPARRGAFLFKQDDVGKMTSDAWLMLKRMIDWALE
jgi:hypothetical protein